MRYSEMMVNRMTEIIKYDEMKSTREQWLGEIPASWGTLRLKRIFTIKKDIAGEEGHTVLSVTQKGIRPKVMSEKGQFALDYSKYQLVNRGEFVMNHMDLLTGWVDISDYDGVTSPDYRVFVNSDPSKYDSSYYRYIFQLCYSARIFYGLGQGVAGFGRWRLPADMFLNFVLPVPSIGEQRSIAAYLDDKVSQIDSIIEEEKASIEEYKQWKASTIFEAVTKGLSQDAEMKYSGIEWIGDIPKTSRLIRLRYLVQDYKAGPFGSSLITDKLLHEGDILVYTPEHVARKNTTSEKNLYLPEERAEEMEQFFVHAGDIVFPIVGSLGRAMMITEEMPCGIINQRLAKFSLRENAVDPDYFMWVFGRSSFFTPYIEVNCRGSFIVNLTKTIVYDMPFVLPMEKAEQRRIAKYLDKKCGTIDAMIAEKESVILDLESFKRSLIYEIVTGKRMVV